MMRISKRAVPFGALTGLVAAMGLWPAVRCPAQPITRKEARSEIRAMEKKGWKLTFDDEFNGAALDRTKWIDSYPDNVRTHGAEELEYYAPDGYEVTNGILRLKGENRSTGEGKPYTAGMVTTFGKFAQQYGWFEMRAKFPKGKGYWPAFWLLPDDKTWPPEIDVLEILGDNPNKDYMTNHYRNAEGKHEGKGSSFIGPDFSADFHTFALDWEPGSITWYVDGVQRYQTTDNVPNVPMYILANLAIGGTWGGNPDATTAFPGYMDIDYIRAYQKA